MTDSGSIEVGGHVLVRTLTDAGAYQLAEVVDSPELDVTDGAPEPEPDPEDAP